MVVGVPGVVGVVGLVAPVAGPVVAVVLAVAVVLVPAVAVPPRLSIHHVLDTAALVIQPAITVQSVQYSTVQALVIQSAITR